MTHFRTYPHLAKSKFSVIIFFLSKMFYCFIIFVFSNRNNPFSTKMINYYIQPTNLHN